MMLCRVQNTDMLREQGHTSKGTGVSLKGTSLDKDEAT